jgi:photosystem II stability/assembly factor-like uncharacterized protein
MKPWDPHSTRTAAAYLVVTLLLATLGTVLFVTSSSRATAQVSSAPEAMLYAEDFEDGQAQDWDLPGGWEVTRDSTGNSVLHGKGHTYAQFQQDSWCDYSLVLRVKIVKGRIHLNFRIGGCTRYFIGLEEQALDLRKTSPCGTHKTLRSVSQKRSRGRWYEVKIAGSGGKIDVYVDGALKLSQIDPEPLLCGWIGLETLDDSEFFVDDVKVLGQPPTATGLRWVRTGGPLGGLGYDIRMCPDNPDVMYVTDAWSGVHKSTDGGKTWVPANEGITTRAGESGDAIPVFCLTLDPGDPDTIWIGTQNTRGIFRSTDAGATWERRDNGVVEKEGITFRGFAVDPRDPRVVYAAAELSSWAWAGEPRPGREFDRTKGVIYKTTDAGAQWKAVWRGDNLARYVWIDPRDSSVLYVSTGIFDREAANDQGVGVVKSTDAGKTWSPVIQGLGNLYVGTLFMQPGNPDVLLAGTGNNQYPSGNGVYLTRNGGQSWQAVLRGENIESVEFSLSEPTIAYAGSPDRVYRSDDAGATWKTVSGGEGGWGAPGVRAGFPIDFQVDPRDPDRLFANNYGGGNFASADGGKTWAVASTGYTGAQVRDIAVSPADATAVYAAARSGLFLGSSAGEEWSGLNDPPHASMEWYVVALDPVNGEHVLAANNWERDLLESTNGGRSWHARQASPGDRKSWRAIAFAPTDPRIVYAGTSAYFSAGTFSDEMPGSGVYASRDGGATWQAANDSVSRDANVCALAVDPRNAQVVYAATGNRGLLRTTDAGKSWAALSSGLPKTASVLCVTLDPRNPDVVYAGLLNGGLCRSTDAGKTWRASSAGMNPEASVSDIVVDSTRVGVLYAADRRSGVFRSSDAGRTWSPLKEGLRMRAVNALALSSDGRVLYAATEGEGVYRLDLP